MAGLTDTMVPPVSVISTPSPMLARIAVLSFHGQAELDVQVVPGAGGSLEGSLDRLSVVGMEPLEEGRQVSRLTIGPGEREFALGPGDPAGCRVVLPEPDLRGFEAQPQVLVLLAEQLRGLPQLLTQAADLVLAGRQFGQRVPGCQAAGVLLQEPDAAHDPD